MVFYGSIVNPGKSIPLVPHPEGWALHLSQASLPASVKEKSRVSLMIKVADEEPIVLCTLCAGVQDSIPLDQFVSEYAELSVQGSGPVHITGYFSPNFGAEDDEDEDEEGEDGYGLHPMDQIYDMHDGDEDEDEDESEDEDEDESEFDSEDYDAMAPRKEPSVIIEDITDKEPDTSKALPASAATPAGDGKKRKAAEAAAEETAAKKQAKEQKQQQQKEQQQQQKVQKEQQKQQKEQKQQQAAKQEAKQQPKEQKQKEQKQPAKTPEVKTPGGSAAQPVASKKGVRKYENGFEIHSTKMGDPNGKLAKAGKRVLVKYVGKLKTGKVFDKTGNKPFTFRLGVGDVIKGWDVGVEGMRVGDVRKLVIPPQMGYGSSRTGPIPPNSTLEFEVELVDVK